MRVYADIFLSFFRIGLFTFGGGYSMLPMFRRDLVIRKEWLTDTELTDFFSVSQCLPGIIAVNTSMFIGNKHAGRIGGVAAALGVIAPSVIIILIIASLISGFSHLEIVRHAFAGIRVCVTVLIINTVAKLYKGAIIDLPSLLICIAVFIVSTFTSFPVAILVIAAAGVGIGIKALDTHIPKNKK